MMDLDITKEMLELSKAGLDVFKEMLRLSGLILLPTGELAVKRVREALSPAGFVNPRELKRLTEGEKTTFREMPEPLDQEILNQELKKQKVPAALQNGHPALLHYAESDSLGVAVALDAYKKRMKAEEEKEKSLATITPDMTQTERSNAEAHNERVEEMFQTDEVETPFLSGLMNERQKERYDAALQAAFRKGAEPAVTAPRAKAMVEDLEKQAGGRIVIGEEGRNLRSVLGKVKLSGDPAKDRALLADKIASGMSKENQFVELMDKKALCFIDNNSNLILLNLKDCKAAVNKLTPDNEARVRNLLGVLSEKREINRSNLDLMLPKGFPDERRRFLLEMYDKCLLRPELRDDVNMIANYIIYAEKGNSVTWKDTLLWESAQEGLFDPMMVRMDTRRIEEVYSAVRGDIKQEYIQHMIRQDYTAEQMHGAADYIRQNGNPTLAEVDAFAEKLSENQTEIRNLLIHGGTQDLGKKSWENVLEVVADRRLEDMARSGEGLEKVYLFDPVGREADHIDKSGTAWYEAYRNGRGGRILVNEEKTQAKYETEVNGGRLEGKELAELAQKKEAYTDCRGEKFYAKGRMLVNEKGKRIKQIKTEFAADMLERKAAERQKVLEASGRELAGNVSVGKER